MIKHIVMWRLKDSFDGKPTHPGSNIHYTHRQGQGG